MRTTLLAVAAASACATLAPGPASAFQDAIDEWAAAAGHYGVSAAVVFPDGSEWFGVAGRAGNEPLRPDHLIAIASITKTVTGAIVLHLAETGALSLEDSVSRWLPPHPNIDPTISVRQLLNHTSGLANYTANPALAAAVARDLTHRFTIDELLEFVTEPAFPAGTATRYTNTAFLLLARIAERAAGRPISELYRELLWEPLGLTEIFLPGASDPPGPVAPALTKGAVVDPLGQMSTLTAANAAFGLMASARDVARWGHALFSGAVLSAGMQAEMRTLVPAAGNIPGETGAGLGIRSYQYLGRTQFGHSGGSTLGSSLLLFDPESGVTVAVVMNQGTGADHFQLAPRLLSLAAGR